MRPKTDCLAYDGIDNEINTINKWGDIKIVYPPKAGELIVKPPRADTYTYNIVNGIIHNEMY